MGLPDIGWLSLGQTVTLVMDHASVSRVDAETWIRECGANGTLSARGDYPNNISQSPKVRAAHPSRSSRPVDRASWRQTIDWEGSHIGDARYFDVRVKKGCLIAALGGLENGRPQGRANTRNPKKSDGDELNEWVKEHARTQSRPPSFKTIYLEFAKPRSLSRQWLRGAVKTLPPELRLPSGGPKKSR